VLQQADLDHNDKVSASELQKLGEKWWQEWDVEKTGSLTEEQLGNGLVKAFPMPPGFGGPGRGPGGPGPGRP
jgi:hypothetical protein